MGELKIESLTAYDADGNEVFYSEFPTTISLDIEGCKPYEHFNQTEFSFDCKMNKKTKWKLNKLIINYESLSLYYKFRVWIGFWLSI